MDVNRLLSTALFTLLFIVYLVIEVFLAMVTYMYLNLNYPSTFGWLTRLSWGLLNSFNTYLEQLSPDLANKAYSSVLGELGPKSVLLLLLGLTVSAVLRLLIWAVRGAIARVRG